MTVQTLDASAVLVFSTAELQEEQLLPSQLTADQVLPLVRRSFHMAGLPLPQETSLEIETYPAAHGVLVFVRPRRRLVAQRPPLPSLLS